MSTSRSSYRICPDCGAHLDPGERCDCESTPDVYASAEDDSKRELVAFVLGLPEDIKAEVYNFLLAMQAEKESAQTFSRQTSASVPQARTGAAEAQEKPADPSTDHEL